jgi:hypothetical protein
MSNLQTLLIIQNLIFIDLVSSSEHTFNRYYIKTQMMGEFWTEAEK